MSDSERKVGFGVAASPFNPIKLELVLFLLGAVLLWLVFSTFIKQPHWEYPTLLLYAGLGLVWLVLRTRKILHTQQKKYGTG